MTNGQSLADLPHAAHAPQRPSRQWRRWLWGISSWLRIGGLLATCYIAFQASWAGALALTALLSGIVLRHFLEATSYGD